MGLYLIIHWTACVQFLVVGGMDADVAEDAWTRRAGIRPDEDVGRAYVVALCHCQLQLFIGDTGLVGVDLGKHRGRVSVTTRKYVHTGPAKLGTAGVDELLPALPEE